MAISFEVRERRGRKKAKGTENRVGNGHVDEGDIDEQTRLLRGEPSGA